MIGTNDPIRRRLFGDRLRAIRNFRRLNQDDLGKRAGISSGAISGWERGVRWPRTRADLFNVAKVLGCEVRWLEGLDDSPDPLTPIPMTEADSAIQLAEAAHAAAKREKLYCKRTTAREVGGEIVEQRCTDWAFHLDACSFEPLSNFERRRFETKIPGPRYTPNDGVGHG